MYFKSRHFIFFILILIVFSSCSGLVGGRKSYYMQQNIGGSAKPEEPSVAPPPPSVSTAQDPFLFEENNVEDAGGFRASDIDSWTLETYFDKRNVALHKFITDKSKLWVKGDEDTGEFLLTGQETYTEVVSGNMGKIKDVTYAVYRGKNDHFFADDPYNTEPINGVLRMERFRFYRFFGTPASGPKLDNRLMAIDTMTKLIFTYSKPVKFQTVVGQNVPIGWEAVDTATVISGNTRPFYEYDPIGVLHKDGKVEFFDTYVNNTAAAKYDPVIGDPSREVAASGKPGRSPYYVVDAEVAAGEFLTNVKGKTFSFRQSTGSSEFLYTYTFCDDGEQLTRSLTKWRGEAQSIGSFSFSNALSEKIALFGEKKMRLSDDFNTLYIDDVAVGYVDYNDMGPTFPDRVKGLTFTEKDYLYEFSSDGKSVTLSGMSGIDSNGIFKIYGAVGSNKTLYKKDNQLMPYGFALFNEEKNGTISIDTVIKKSYERGADGAVLGNATSHPAYLVVGNIPENPEEAFLNSIRNKTYYYRSNEAGKSDVLEIITVSENGKEIIRSEREWRKYKNIQKDTYAFSTVTDSSTGKYGEEIVTVSNNGSVIGIEGKQYKLDFKDSGPLFVDRVKNNTFGGSGYIYNFSSDGSSITVTGKADTTYTLVGTNHHDYAEYEESYSFLGLIPSKRYWGVKITTDGSIVDSIIHWTPTPMLTTGTHILPGTATANPAWLEGFESDVADLTLEEKFLYALSAKTYSYRSTTDGISDTLETYTFDSDGRSATKHTQKWQQTERVRIYGLMLSKIISDTEGTFTVIDITESENQDSVVTLGEVNIVLSNYGNNVEFNPEVDKTYMANFSDPGPLFVDRVKGRTYLDKDDYKYIFSEDGRSVTYYIWTRDGLVWKDWYWKGKGSYAIVDRSNKHTEAAYKHSAGYFPMRLLESDTKLQFSTSFADPNHSGVWHNDAYRQ